MFPRALALLLLVCLAAASCTFPTVEYSAPCAVPEGCKKSVNQCSKQARSARDVCANQCKAPKDDCALCAAIFDTGMSECLNQCEACSEENGCANPSEACGAALGLP